MMRFLVTSSEHSEKLIQGAIYNPSPSSHNSDESMVNNPSIIYSNY